MPPPVVRRAPYKDFLQPALQGRFASTVGVVLGLAYIESLTLSTWNSLIWSWFPIGLAGLRTLTIFACVLPLIILRIAHSHIGLRTSNSPLETFRRMIWQFQPVETFITYALSFWLFSQTYLLSIPEDSNIHWITYYSGDRPRLNERALFYTVNLIFVGVVEALIHLAYDYDRLKLKTVEHNEEGHASPQRPDPWQRWISEAPRILLRAGLVSTIVSLLNYIAVYSLLRNSAWGWAMTFFRVFYSNLPKTNIPPSQAPWSIWMLGRSIWASYLFLMLWDIADLTFTLQLEKGPFKNNLPLTTESKDPNGSLINGLKSKKPRIQAFAVSELAYIARDFEDRRKSIFEDIDRKDGPAWSQLYIICLNIVKSIEQRIDDYGKPPAPPAALQTDETQSSQPRPRAAQPLKDEDVWAPAAARGISGSVGKVVGSITQNHGKTPIEVLVPEAKKRALVARDHILTAEQKEVLTSDGFGTVFRSLALRVIRLPIPGWFFQHTFDRRLTTVILGTPYGELSVYVNAAFALSQLGVSSLTEDRYGNVQRDIPTLIRIFTTVIKKLEKFHDELPSHWTDVEQDKRCDEYNELLDALKVDLGRLIECFGPYSADLRLSRADMRLAREAAERRTRLDEEEENGRPAGIAGEQRRPEMRQVN